MSYHAFSEVILYPYASSFGKEAMNKNELRDVAKEMQSAIYVGENFLHFFTIFNV